MNKPLEILAPVGSPEALKAAVRCGADAVYLGASAFHARRHSQSFSDDDLPQVVSYCHARGTAVHLTLNTLIREEEMEKALAVAKAACASGVDALIVQNTYGMGYFGVESAYKLLAGQGSSVEKSNITATRTITRENMFAMDKQKVLFPFG